MGIFNLEEVKRESGLSAPEFTQLEEKVRREFEGDEMMFELHLSRALKALKEGWVTLEEALSESALRSEAEHCCKEVLERIVA